MLDKNIDVSIIVPIYNVKPYLKQCLNSILYQSFYNFEVLLIDDGSIDNSSDICLKFSKIDARFKYIRKPNGGLSDARNAGIYRAKGKYIVFIDGDDYIDRDYIERLYNAIKSRNCDVAICGFYRVNEKKKLIDSNNLNMINSSVVSGLDVIKHSFDKNGWGLTCAWNKIYKRSLFDNLKFEKGRYYEDGFIFPPLFVTIEKVCIVHAPLYYYVQRNNSIIHSTMNIKKIKDGNLSLLNAMSTFKRIGRFDLYTLSVQNYKNWILAVWMRNRSLIKKHKFDIYLRSQYRKYVRLKFYCDKKSALKDILGYINLDFYFLLWKFLVWLK